MWCWNSLRKCLMKLFTVSAAVFLFEDTARPEIYTLSLHDALPSAVAHAGGRDCRAGALRDGDDDYAVPAARDLHRNEPDAVHSAFGGVAVRLPAQALRLAAHAGARFRLAARARLLYCGERADDGLRRDLAPGGVADGLRDGGGGGARVPLPPPAPGVAQRAGGNCHRTIDLPTFSVGGMRSGQSVTSCRFIPRPSRRSFQ